MKLLSSNVFFLLQSIMKPNILDETDRAAILERISRLDPGSPRQWGQLSLNQMVIHLADQIRMALGIINMGDKSSFLTRYVFKPLVLRSKGFKKNFKSGAKMAAPLESITASQLQELREVLVQTIKTFVATAEKDLHPHFVFGPMNKKQWGRLIYMHLDHHLTQFGV
jgi:hypothetical protein